MKGLIKTHKNSAIIMCISSVFCVCSGMRGQMKLHKWSAAAMCISGAVCMYSGWKMVNPKKTASEQ